MSACLVLHGFTGSPHEILPLAVFLKENGFEVHTPTLAGHGATRQEMRQATRIDWIESAEIVLQNLLAENQQVHLIGFSMGGLIAACLASKYPVKSLVLLSTPIFYVNKKQMIRTVSETLRNLVLQRTAKETARRYSAKIRRTPLRSVMQFRRLVAEMKPRFSEVSVPALIVQGEKDDLVEPRSAQFIYNTIGSSQKQIHFFQESAHMICLGCDQQEVNRLVAGFLNQIDGEVDV